MKHLLAAVVYTGVALLANPGLADMAAVEALRDGTMKKLVFHDEPQPVPATTFIDVSEAPISLEEMRGEWLVVNFWATWCAPCRKEMPTLANLQTHFEGAPVEVVTIATGRNAPEGIRRFFEEIGVDNLPQHRDPKQALAREMGVLGLPITVIIDPDGREVARLRGDADWDSDSAVAILEALSSGS
ncbi:TlpA family protein disulfide reductase [Tropicimonas sediminicola]|uniref:Thiol-disulfide isomerase or thioredoxin n=1 Tax=Tropicimonas sediminicola TaxID=1031541 RepID=A0A239C7M9_9RHOB|nr:TlpA disulfide reductase family protein [Tropicimonas sediminicola]SNS15902.1 Thiol-disulfide isomerase or thioredoxin [Tropicimonas sediminicola]